MCGSGIEQVPSADKSPSFLRQKGPEMPCSLQESRRLHRCDCFEPHSVADLKVQLGSRSFFVNDLIIPNAHKLHPTSLGRSGRKSYGEHRSVRPLFGLCRSIDSAPAEAARTRTVESLVLNEGKVNIPAKCDAPALTVLARRIGSPFPSQLRCVCLRWLGYRAAKLLVEGPLSCHPAPC
jgi:hypothetical protein